MERKNAWKAYSDEQITELEEVNKSYREFLTVGKTERECVKEIIKQAEATGYQVSAVLYGTGTCSAKR